MSITYSECVSVVLVTQHAVRMRLILSSMACVAVLSFPSLSRKQRDLREKKLVKVKCLFFYNVCLKYI
jgi:hypothetical protein